MAMILSRAKTIDLNLFKTFYFRRIKRIVPLYLIVTAITYIIGRYCLFHEDLTSFRKHALWSLIFASNFKLNEEQDYFRQVKCFYKKQAGVLDQNLSYRLCHFFYPLEVENIGQGSRPG